MRTFLTMLGAVSAFNLAPGAALNIDGQSNKTYDGGSYSNLSIKNSTGITVKNAKFAGTGAVINIDGSSDVVVDNCEADGLGEACVGVNIRGASHHLTIKNCHIHNIADDGFQLRGTNLNNITIQGNRIHKLLGKGTDGVVSGPCYNGHSDGIETANTDRVSIIGNILYDIKSTSAIIVGDDTNMKIHNNICYTPETAITVYHHKQTNTEIYHNTFWGSHFAGLAIGKNVLGLKAYNNIIHKIDFSHLGGTYDNTKMSIDYNVVSMVGVGYTYGAHDKMYPAMSFTNMVNAYSTTKPTEVTIEDFGLLAGSPAINNGKTGLGITTDILGNPRDAQPDMGAIEYQNTGMRNAECGMKNPEALFSALPFPNPMTTSITFPLDGQIKKANKVLRIYGRSGKTVYTRSSNQALEYFTWDGRCMMGNKVKPGQYFFTFGINGKTDKGSIIITR